MSKPKKIKVEINDVQFHQRSPRSLIERVDADARQQKCSRNRMVNEILKNHYETGEQLAATVGGSK